MRTYTGALGIPLDRVATLRRVGMIQLTSISGSDEIRDFDQDFDQENENFDHDFDDKGGLFTMM